MARQGLVDEGLRIVNEGGDLQAWARRVRVAEVNALAERLGVSARTTKAATVSALSRAPRPAVVEEGHRLLLEGRSIRAWSRRAKAVEVNALAERVGVEPSRNKETTRLDIEDTASRARVLDRQARRLDVLQRRQDVRLAQVYQNARRVLFERVTLVSSSRPGVRIRQYLSAIDVFGQRLRRNLIRSLATSERQLHQRIVSDMAALLDLDEATRARMQTRLAQRQRLRAYRFNVDRMVSELTARLQREVVTLTRATAGSVARRLAGPTKSVIANFTSRAALMNRVETWRIYNDGQLEAAEEIEPGPGKKVRRRIDEVLDARNHPFSRAANGQTADLGSDFRVSVAEVARWGATLRKPVSGIFWRRSGASYVGRNLPAHFNDRGRVVIEVVGR